MNERAVTVLVAAVTALVVVVVVTQVMIRSPRFPGLPDAPAYVPTETLPPAT